MVVRPPHTHKDREKNIDMYAPDKIKFKFIEDYVYFSLTLTLFAYFEFHKLHSTSFGENQLHSSLLQTPDTLK